MIRDPSDGIVRENVDNDHGAKREAATGDQKVPLPHESGLREQNQNADYLARLNRSREWLADRRARIINRLIGESSQG